VLQEQLEATPSRRSLPGDHRLDGRSGRLTIDDLRSYHRIYYNRSMLSCCVGTSKGGLLPRLRKPLAFSKGISNQEKSIDLLNSESEDYREKGGPIASIVMGYKVRTPEPTAMCSSARHDSLGGKSSLYQSLVRNKGCLWGDADYSLLSRPASSICGGSVPQEVAEVEKAWSRSRRLKKELVSVRELETAKIRWRPVSFSGRIRSSPGMLLAGMKLFELEGGGDYLPASGR